ncbi:DUF485 domain-containing protein [Nocardioides sp.]|uniref:DUF485 domain-containing protein n=1 Tax=Nocardioides sp. TaxID=35761 RepID=UPI0035178DA0
MAHDLHKTPEAPAGAPEGGRRASTRSEELFDELHASPEFAELRRRYRGFAIPASIAFLAWFLLYVVMSNWATGFMSTKVFGNVNIALLFGLLQFATTFAIAWAYARFSSARLDPLAGELYDRFEAGQPGTQDGGRA